MKLFEQKLNFDQEIGIKPCIKLYIVGDCFTL